MVERGGEAAAGRRTGSCEPMGLQSPQERPRTCHMEQEFSSASTVLFNTVSGKRSKRTSSF